MSKNSIVDTGVPPHSVQEAKKKKREIMESKVPQEKPADMTKQGDVTPEVGFTPAPKIRTFEAILVHDLYTITLEVLDISISDFQVALKIPKTTGFKFEPMPQSSFNLRTKGKNYILTYLGGLFDFPSDDHWTITFLMEQEVPHEEKIRNSNNTA